MLETLMQFRHRRFRRDLSAYVDNMLSERARRRLEAHLDSCQACRQELAELRVTIKALGSLPLAEAPRSFTLAAAPVAEVRPRPAARRLEFGLRLATATAAFALALVMIGDFTGLPGGGEEKEDWVRGQLFSAEQETPAAMEPAPVETTTLMEGAVAQTPAADETPRAAEAAPAETPAVEQTPTPPEAAPAETPAAMGAAPVETPAAEQTPAPTGAAPVETPPAVVPGITEPYGGEFGFSAGISEEETPENKALEGAEVDEEAEAGAAEAQPVAAEEGGGLSREEVVRWLEIGLGAGVGILVILWALARFQRSIGTRP
jgi:hypothetical protein